MNILDNVKGSFVRSQRVYCGPSLGWIEAPIFQDTAVTGNHTVQPYESVFLCSLAAPATLMLPPLLTWLQNTYGSWPIYVKDVLGNFSSFSLTVATPDGKSIDGQSTLALVGDFSSVIIRPRSDAVGWYST